MATTKLWKVEGRIDKVINYATNKKKTKNVNYNDSQVNIEYSSNILRSLLHYAANPDKTEKKYFETGINCEVESSYEEMMDTKTFYNKLDGILAYHGYQSFEEGEVTPEMAHEIGIRLAKEIWGDKFEVVVTTHLNTHCLHNHFVVNSVSFKDGKKYYSNRTNTALLRHTSDEICKEYGLSVIEEKPCKKSKINFDNYYKKYQQKDNYHNTTKRDIDLAIRQAYSFDDFLFLMKKLDYEVIFRADKISVRKFNRNKNIRLVRSFGEDYTIDNIRRRIIEETAVRVPFIEDYYRKVSFPFEKRHKRAKAKGFIALYYHYCYLLKVFPTKVPQQRLPASIRADVIRMEELSNEAKLLVKNNIKDENQLNAYIDNTNSKIKEILSKRRNLWEKRKDTQDEQEKVNIGYDISIYNEELKKLREEVRLCNDIKTRIPKIDKNLDELDSQEKHEREKKQEKNKERRKHKDEYK
ncbi:MAG: relaxase/mobilization nuclease domain-containing protein [Clostridia bacterium]|nr:relaxase/mobilization nuclease domain-containing protein [Clostridia bacterium]